MAKLSTAIMAHPNREGWVPGLENKLGNAEVVWDRKNSRWDTGRRALLAYKHDATHHLIVQDDAILSKNFLNSCRRLIKHSGDHPVALYMGSSSAGFRRKAHYAHSNGIPWFLAAGPRWGVAVIVPTPHIADLVDWCDEDSQSEAYDGKMTLYYHKRRKSCLYTVPSLVNHREVEDNPSLVEGRHANRTAFYYTGEAAADWSISPEHRAVRVKSCFQNKDSGRKRIVNMYGEQYKKLKNDKGWVLVK